MKHRYYEIHTWTLCDGWINCWTTTDERGTLAPDTYPTVEATQAAIDEFLEDIQAEIDAGERAPDEGYDPEELGIAEVKNEKKTPLWQYLQNLQNVVILKKRIRMKGKDDDPLIH